MALDARRLQLRHDIPRGQMASKVIKAVHQDTRSRVFPMDTLYATQPSERRSLKKSTAIWLTPETRDSRIVNVLMPKERVIERRDFSYPSKVFTSWKIPRKYSASPNATATSVAALQECGSAVASRSSSRLNRSMSDLQPLERRQRSAIERPTTRNEKVTALPRLHTSFHERRPLIPRTYTAAQKFLEGRTDENSQLDKIMRSKKADHVLQVVTNQELGQFMRSWFSELNANDHQNAVSFFTSTPGQCILKHFETAENTESLEKILSDIKKNKVRRSDQNQSLRNAYNKQKRLQKLYQLQTWHHMPVYPDKRTVDDPRSMFLVANKRIPHSYRIHPEWS